jgi:hypothetical protein
MDRSGNSSVGSAAEEPAQPIVQRPEQTELDRRRQRAAESILDNESLTSNLDDDAARRLIDWGLSCAEQIVLGTAGVAAEKAEDATYPRLRATRRLMRLVNRWIRQRLQMTPDESATLLGQIVRQAEIVYGQGFVLPKPERQRAFAAMAFGDEPTEIIRNLREFIEHAA